jgi:hypothetical protein
LTNTEVVGRFFFTASYPRIVSALVTMAIGVGVGIGVAVEIGKRKAISLLNPIAAPAPMNAVPATLSASYIEDPGSAGVILTNRARFVAKQESEVTAWKFAFLKASRLSLR